MQLYFLVIVISILLYCCKRRKEVITYYENGKVEEKYEVDERGVKNGIYSSYYPSGHLEITGPYRNGKADGEFMYYDSSGKLWKIKSYEMGTLFHLIEFEGRDTTSDTWYASLSCRDSIKLGDTLKAELHYHEIEGAKDSFFTLYTVPMKLYNDLDKGLIKEITGKKVNPDSTNSFIYIPTVIGEHKIWGSVWFRGPGKKRDAAYFEKTIYVY